MNKQPKKTNEKPSSNFQEPLKDPGNQAVKKPEDKDYTKEKDDFKNPARDRERSEQPVDPIRKAPAKGQ